MKKKLASLLSTLLFCTHAAVAESAQPFDIAKSWEKAVVYVPSSFFPKSTDTIEVDSPKPVLILMHGCGGISDHERRWADYFKSLGVIVVMPDSFAIPGRQKNCDSSSNTTNLNIAPVHQLRPAEAEFAMEKIKGSVWADKKNIFLMGHSEGGIATHLTPDLGFRGIIISGFVCSIRGGIRARSDIPVLAINWEKDPWFSRPGKPNLKCSDRRMWLRRSNASELILPGSGHATGYEFAARQAAKDFLTTWIER